MCNIEGKDLNRLKVVLAEKKHTNKWLAEQLVLIKPRFPNGVPTVHNPTWRT